MNPLESYLRDLHLIRSTGASLPETSFYGPLQNLLNEIGKTLKPKVRCVMGLADQGAGFPDGGLFTPDQFQKSSAAPLRGTGSFSALGEGACPRIAAEGGQAPRPRTNGEPVPLPARGVIEAKPAGDDAWVTSQGKQVTRYWGTYRTVLVTNYRDFVLVGRDPDGRPAKLESYRLAESEGDFWAAAAHPRKAAEEHAERFTEYLKRVLLHEVALATPQALAWFLASYARDAKARIEQRLGLPALAAVRTALEEALGLKFEGDKGEHFFRSSLIQTLFYGVFSAWVLWAKKLPHDDRGKLFDWRMAAWSLHVPMVRALFDQVATPHQLQPLGLVEVLDWAAAALNRVDRESFFAQFEEEHAVQYFYEPFLQAFDPELRKELGVWFTPPEIVQYMVARVDTVLREELDIEDGLADRRVYVLDPCCGTGSYLVEVLHRIATTLRDKGGDALVAQDLKRAAMERIFGFEILPAPFVVAHLQLGILLDSFGSPLDDARWERVAVFLTNALTGWEPPKEPKTRLLFPELQEERDAADRVKRDTPILVILGNPPYNAFAGVSPAEEQGLVEPYKQGLISEWGIKKFNLDDLYVRFFRLAERRIAEMTGQGIICYISNFSYLSDPSFVVMRHRFLQEFDKIWIDCMNGDSRETGKRTPEGKPDPSVFSTEQNPQGIRLGTAIGLLVRKGTRSRSPVVRYRDFWGISKRSDLLDRFRGRRSRHPYALVRPDSANRYTWRALRFATEYMSWPRIVELCSEVTNSGVQEMRKGAVIDIDPRALAHRLKLYLDPAVDWEALARLKSGLTLDAGGFRAREARASCLGRMTFDQRRIVPYALHPFDTRWCYYTTRGRLWNRARPDLAAQCWPGNQFIVTRMFAERPQENVPVTVTAHLPDYHLLRPNVVAIPILLSTEEAAVEKQRGKQNHLFPELEGPDSGTVANLSVPARRYLAALGYRESELDGRRAKLLWMHALAIGHAPAYLSGSADAIHHDWMRIPLPNRRPLLEASAALGHQVAALLDTERPVKGVTCGKTRPELKGIGVASRVGGGQLGSEADRAVTAGWGHGGKGGVTMPGSGKAVERPYTPEELAAIQAGAGELGLSREEALRHLGTSTLDIYLNGVAYWRNVPARVWDYRIGGYQVMKKWLSYRESDLLGRSLTLDEAHYVMEMARRLAALVLLEPALDANYQAVKASTYPWPGTEPTAEAGGGGGESAKL